MTPPLRPGPDARLVGRARSAAFLGFACIAALSAAGFADHSLGGYVAAVVCLAAGAFGIAALARTRVWIDGDVLYARKLGGWDVPIRLDRLTQAWLSSSSPSLLYLADDERELKLDALNLRLKPLYAELAEQLGPDSPLPDSKLRRRISRAARGGRLGRLHRSGQRVDVVDAHVPPPIDEEGRRAGDATGVGAADVLRDPPRVAAPPHVLGEAGEVEL
jgi:hypothetical protein